jgi:peptidoglycan/LPS O-acetylase OafA/YrhL
MYLRGNIWQDIVASIQHVPPGEERFTQRYIERIYYPTYTRLDGLLAGVLLAVLKVFRPDQWALVIKHANKILLVGLGGLWLAIATFSDRFGYDAATYGYPLLAFSFALIVAAASSSSSIIGRFKVPGAYLLATLAFSLYLTHKSVFHVVKTTIGPQLRNSGYLAFFVYGLSVFATGIVLYLVVERPFLQLRRKLLVRNNKLSGDLPQRF